MMRLNRPEFYSDSKRTQAYKLNRPVFSHHLGTLTERNQHKPFEDFCRALAQREICPNLRPVTGPEGGGDGKVDTETYPVASEISERWYEGVANDGEERWAFAFSAKKRWSEKVRKDIKGIVETRRAYSRIHFFTNQNPRAINRLRIEQELNEEYEVPVTIYDRNWIEEKTIDHSHEDLAYDILGVGEFDASLIAKGPQDTYREAELTEIETAFTQRDKSRMTNLDSVSEALRAAKLSRGLECSRNETDGRFLRAIRLAKKYGTTRQHLVAMYEHAWTLIWWFDDIDAANEYYDEIETLALASHASADLEKLGNLINVFFGVVQQGGVDSNQFRLEERSSALASKLQNVAADTSAPNNALYAESLLVLHRYITLIQHEKLHQSDGLWKQFISIVDRAQGLGEFPAELIDKLVTALSQFGTESETFDELVLKLADFMGNRQKDGKQGEIFFRRGCQKLDADKPVEAIDWLGKAAVAFTKKEYQIQQIEILYTLAIAYQGAGLFWAARATALSCLLTLSILSDEDGRIYHLSIPAMKLYILICLQLGHIPDVLQGMFTLLYYQNHMTLSEEDEERLHKEILELDQLLSCAIMAMNKSELCRLSELPSVLEHLQLFTTRTVLLCRLGYQDELRSDGSIPEEESDSEVAGIMQSILSLSATEELPKLAILNDTQPFEIATKILGVQVNFKCDPQTPWILICELLISSLEGFASTMLNRGVYPCTSHADVMLTISDKKIDIQIDPHTFSIRVLWPEEIIADNPSYWNQIQKAVIEFVASTIGLISSTQDIESLIKELVHSERAFDRSILFSNTGISHSRVFGNPASKLDNIPVPSKLCYPLKDDAPDIETTTHFNVSKHREKSDFIVRRHTDMSVYTVINPYLWDDAKWHGTGYFIFDINYPPVLGLHFRNPEAGFKIFKQLQERFGPVDMDELIRVAILKGIDRSKPLHYRVHIAASRAAYEMQSRAGKPVMLVSRHHLMEAETHRNMNVFINHYQRLGAFYFAPVENSPDGIRPKLDLSVIKRDFYITDAWKVGTQHDDAPAISPTDDITVPTKVNNPPIYELQKFLKLRGRSS